MNLLFDLGLLDMLYLIVGTCNLYLDVPHRLWPFLLVRKQMPTVRGMEVSLSICSYDEFADMAYEQLISKLN